MCEARHGGVNGSSNHVGIHWSTDMRFAGSDGLTLPCPLAEGTIGKCLESVDSVRAHGGVSGKADELRRGSDQGSTLSYDKLAISSLNEVCSQMRRHGSYLTY